MTIIKIMETIIFCGTPEFAVPSLEILLKRTDLKVAAVVTQPDKFTGRHHTTKESCPVKKTAVTAGITVLQPEKFSDCAEELRAFTPALGIVVAYGQKIPAHMLSIPRYGWINIHASLLPKYRGASPIQSAILDGNAQTGVTLMQIEKGMDTGAIFAQQKIEITKDDTTETLSEKLAHAGAALLDEKIKKLITGKLPAVPQNQETATHCLKITKEAGALTFKDQTATELHNAIRALTPWPGCFTFWNGQRIKIHKASTENSVSSEEPGTVINQNNRIGIVCKKEILSPLIVQKEGKKAVTIEEFVRGNPDFIGAHLTAQ